MNTNRHLLGAALLAAGAVLAGAAQADTRIQLRFTSEPFSIQGQEVPAANETLAYWFGSEAARLDVGDWSIIVQGSAGRVVYLNHPRRTYSEHELPISDAAAVVGPEHAALVQEMVVPPSAITDVRPRDEQGEFAGHPCRYTHIEISTSMFEAAVIDYIVDWCETSDLAIDYRAYLALLGARGVLLHSSPWMIPVAQRLGGFPLENRTRQFGAGIDGETREVVESIEERPAPDGHYEIPEGYTKSRYVEILPSTP